MDKNNYMHAAEALLNSISPKAKETLEQIKLSSEFNKAAELCASFFKLIRRVMFIHPIYRANNLL